MYQQKFMPYNQMNDVYEEEEFQEEDSEPLIEQVDPNYQPTEKEVKQYAIEILGMNLPEDQRLLYLAREGLKAPIPANWQPFQGRDGQVYYKHKITQQKTFEHPTDVQYRKRYTQQKERAARKNLKSMSLKSNPLSGFGQPSVGALNQPSFGALNQPSFGALGSKVGINPLGLSNLSSQSHQTINKQVSKLDPKLQEQLRNEVEELQQKLQREFEQFEEQRKLAHEKNMKKYKSEFQNSLSQIKSEKSSASSYEKALKQQKQRIKERLKQAYDDRFKDEFADVQKLQQKKLNEFVQLYEEDNKIKIKKYEVEKEKQFNERIRKLEINEKRHQENKREKQKERQKIISQVKQKYSKDDNQQIQEATKETFGKQLRAIKESNTQKVREFEQQLQAQFSEMNKLLGHDPNKALQEIAEKKNRLKKMSQQKIESLKKKEYQKVGQNFTQDLQRQIEEAKLSLEIQNARQIETQKSVLQQKFQALKSRLQVQMKDNLTKKVEQIYCEVKKSTSEYEKGKNKKIMQIREKFISDIVQRSEGKNEELNLKLGLREKEEMIQNKEQLIKSLSRQVQLETFVLKELRMNKTIATSNNVDSQLKKLMGELNIVYKPDVFFKHQKKFNQLKQRYKADKQLLGSMMAQLQNNAFIPFYHQSSNHNHQASTTSITAILVKQYNKDVRVMRNNEEMLANYEVTLRKAELNDQKALSELESQQFVYEDISLRNRVQMERSDEPRLQEIDNTASPFGQGKVIIETSNSYQSVEDKLKSHSKFLSNIKTELNRKLYQVRNNHYFRV